MKINEQWKKEVALEEEQRLFTLLDCCHYLWRQCFTFRGSKDEFDGNFNKLVHLLARWVPIIEYWVGSAHLRPYKVTYLSYNSQNESINLTGDEVYKLIAEGIVSAMFFTVMADTTPDKSNRGQISLVIRYINEKFDIKDPLVKIGKTGSEFTEKVLPMLEELHISSDGIRFHCFDTTSSMSGKYHDAQEKVLIPYIMCMGHKTNLCVLNTHRKNQE